MQPPLSSTEHSKIQVQTRKFRLWTLSYVRCSRFVTAECGPEKVQQKKTIERFLIWKKFDLKFKSYRKRGDLSSLIATISLVCESDLCNCFMIFMRASGELHRFGKTRWGLNMKTLSLKECYWTIKTISSTEDCLPKGEPDDCLPKTRRT